MKPLTAPAPTRPPGGGRQAHPGRRARRLAAWTACSAGLLAAAPAPAFALTLTAPGIAGVEGQPFTGPVATFGDLATPLGCPPYTASVAWADGTAPPGTVAAVFDGLTSCAYTVTATHTFGEEGGEAFTVTVTDARSQATSIPSTATVADALVQTMAAPASAVAGTPLAGVVASFTDEFAGAPVTDFTATVDWGDGAVTTDPTIAAASGGAFTVSAAHTYARAGPFRTTILVRDKAGSAGSAGGTITVTAPSPPPGGATSLPPPPPKPAAPGSPPSLDVSAPRPAGTQTLSLRVACPATASRCLGVARIVTLPSHAKKSPLPGGTSLGSALFVLAPGGSRILYIPVARRLRLILHHAHSARLAGVAIAFAANGQSAAETGPVAAVSTVGLR